MNARHGLAAQGGPDLDELDQAPSNTSRRIWGRTSTCLSACFARGLARAGRRLGRGSAFAEPHSRGIPIEKFNALMLKRFAHLVASRSKPPNWLGAASLHIPNRIVADSNHFSQRLLIKTKQRSCGPQLVS
jgi:hypothetical protein